ncbi:MAG: MBOAT family O-acyltransferase [Paludibacteraceae bacterium]
MLFNSIEFAIFLPIVFLLYWFVFDYALRRCRRQLWWQNLFVLVASYVFYGWWDWKFLLLIALTTLCSYGSGLLIAREGFNRTGGGNSSQEDSSQVAESGLEKRESCAAGCGMNTAPLWKRKFWLWANVLLNLGILGIFKYYDFFVESFARLFGVDAETHLLHLVLPVGISFYTFQALSYSIDVYKGKISATRDLVAFAAFLSFFPQLVAGPIERATNLLPQFQKSRVFDYQQAVDGMRQILWGLFKKIVVADNCATYVDTVFGSIGEQSGSTLALAAVLFTFQIYGDFSGYSDIAIGTAKLFGIRLMRNFNVPYFSRDIAEFWRRWHISLTTWFRDYVYIPLGGSRPEIPVNVRHPEAYKKAIVVRNTFVIFLLSGFWHGANWTFVLWGAYHALLFLPLILTGKNRKYMDAPTWRDLPKILLTFVLVVFGWIIFRATGMKTLTAWVTGIFSPSLFTIPWLMNRCYYIPTFICIALMLIEEWRIRKKPENLLKYPCPLVVRWIIYILFAIYIVIAFNLGNHSEFIYFAF